MRRSGISGFITRSKLHTSILAGFFLLLSCPGFTQVFPPPPPKPISVSPAQSLGFGTFYQGVSGGSVTISSTGVRSIGGGTVVLFPGSYSPAIINVYSNPGTLFSLLLPSTGTLTDGNSHTLTILVDNTTNPVSVFLNSTNDYSVPTQISIGGILTIGSPIANPPGVYSGTIDITFIEE